MNRSQTSKAKYRTKNRTVSSSTININNSCQNTVNNNIPTSIKIEPQLLKFESIKLEEQYEGQISIQNVSEQSVKLKVTGPKTQYFSMMSANQRIATDVDKISPGLTKFITVRFSAISKRPRFTKYRDQRICTEFFDEIRIVLEDQTFEIPLKATKDRGFVTYNTLVNLGFSTVAKPIKVSLQFFNGFEDTHLKLHKDPTQRMEAFPQEFAIASKCSKTVCFSYTPTKIGSYYHKFLVQCQLSGFLKPIQIVYNACDFGFALTDQFGGKLGELDFGYLYQGHKKTVKLFAVNNSPEALQFKSQIKRGWNMRRVNVFQTPQEFGNECSATNIEIFPKSIEIKAFESCQLLLVSSSTVSEEDQSRFQHHAKGEVTFIKPLKQLDNVKLKYQIEDKLTQETLISEFQWLSQNPKKQVNIVNPNFIYTEMKIKYVVPMIKIVPFGLSLGKVYVGETVEAMVEIHNLNKILAVSCSPRKTLGIEIMPKKVTIQPLEKSYFELKINCKVSGEFKESITIIVEELYTIQFPLTYVGVNNPICNSQLTINQLTNFDFQKTWSKIDKSSQSNKYRNYMTQHHHPFGKRKSQPAIETSKSLAKCSRKTIINRQKFEETEQRILSKTSYSTKRVGRINFSCSTQDLSKNEFNTKLKENTLPLPSSKDSLFVCKPIGGYKPYNEGVTSKKLMKFKKNRDYFTDNNVRRVPRNRKEAEEITMELSGDSLKKIEVNNTKLAFGKMFIHSRENTDFIVSNDSNCTIQVKLVENETNIDLLRDTDFCPQLLPAQSRGRFNVVVNANEIGDFFQNITYMINRVHRFQFMVQGEVEPVSLEFSKFQLKLTYDDDISDMYLRDTFVITNAGNSYTQFQINFPDPNFFVEPQSGRINRESCQIIKVEYRNRNLYQIKAGEGIGESRLVDPSKMNRRKVLQSQRRQNINYQSTGEEKLQIQIKDGETEYLKVNFPSLLSQPKCIVKQSNIDFGCTIGSKSKTKSFTLKNLSRNVCLYEIDPKDLSQFFTFDTSKGKLMPQASKEINVTYKSVLLQQFNSSFYVHIRGGLTIEVPMTAESISPKITIVEDSFNFGDICCGSYGKKPITIKNDSETAVELVFDFSNNDVRGIEYLDISFKENNHHENRRLSRKDNILQNDQKSTDSRIHNTTISPFSISTFWLYFKPKVPGFYEFQLPIYLENFSRSQSFRKVITCFAAESKFIIEPAVVRFKKKIINEEENAFFHPLIEFVTLKNSGDKELRWKIEVPNKYTDTSEQYRSVNSVTLSNRFNVSNYSKAVNSRCCFEVENTRGVVKAGAWECINISFNPYEAGAFQQKLPVLIYNQSLELYQQKAEIVVKGEGEFPCLFFDRKELIMPVVPLDIESVGMLKIINQGYENICLKHQIEFIDRDGNHIVTSTTGQTTPAPSNFNLPEISVIYPQGYKMGVNKKELYIILRFTATKPISFTVKFQIFDNARDNRVYEIPVSGTADNSLFSAFPYLVDRDNSFLFASQTVVSTLPKSSQTSSPQAATFLVNIKPNDGRNIIDRLHNHYDSLTGSDFQLKCNVISFWINNILCLDDKKVSFPEEFSKNPEKLTKILCKLLGKKDFENVRLIDSQQAVPHENEQVMNRLATTTVHGGQLFQFHNSTDFYNHILKVLKSYGCLLNQIRPYYLLQQQQFFKYLQQDPNWKYICDTYTKYYGLIHIEAWTILFFQIMNHFWYNISKVKNQYVTADGKSSVGSNIYSNSEMQVLRWVKGIIDKDKETDANNSQKLLSFGKDFKSCVYPVQCIQNYQSSISKNTKLLQNFDWNPHPIDYESNTKILYQLLSKLNITPILTEQEYPVAGDLQLFMFMYHLYQILPQYLPKLAPIVFACQLGEKCIKYLEIKNPSNKTINYCIRKEGSKDFYLEEDYVKIQAKSVYRLKVEFRSRVSNEELGCVTLFSTDSEGSAAASSLVFELKSDILGKKSVKKLEAIYCPLYCSSAIKIPVENLSEEREYGNFHVQLFEYQQTLTQGRRKDKNSHKLSQKTFMEEHGVRNFWIQNTNLKIKKNGSSNLQLVFQPLMLTQMRCYIVFTDPCVGEFQYEILGVAEIPKPIQEIKSQQIIQTDQQQSIEIVLPIYNNMMTKSLAIFEQKHHSKSTRLKTQHEKPQSNEESFKVMLNMDPKIKDYVKFPSQVRILYGKGSSSENMNKIRLDCFFTTVFKDLCIDFILINQYKKDVRRIRYHVCIVKQPFTYSFVMNTTARSEALQKIPIANNSQKEWKIQAVLETAEPQYFSLRENQKCNLLELLVKKGSTQTIIVKFCPLWVGKLDCKVTISNLSLQEHIIYDIKAISEQPVSEGHIYVKTLMGETTTQSVQIKNPYNELLAWSVKSDLKQLSFPNEITLKPNEEHNFEVKVKPKNCNLLIGYLKFIDSRDRYFWHSVTVETYSKYQEQEKISLNTQINTRVETEIVLNNYSQKVIHYKVEFPQGVGLYGQPEIQIRPEKSYHYTLVFKPEQIFKQEAYIKFVSDDVDQVHLYPLSLISKRECKKKLHTTIQTQVGKQAYTEVQVFNNLKKPVKLRCEVDNTDFFSIEENVTIAPESKGFVRVCFEPAHEGRQIANIQLYEQNRPKKVYEIEGIGLPPCLMERINFRAPVGSSKLEIIKIKNPDPQKLDQKVSIMLEDNGEQHGCFTVIDSPDSKAWDTNFGNILGIPVQFSSTAKGCFQSMLSVETSNHHWKFLLKGTDIISKNEEIISTVIEADCRKQVIKILKVQIPEHLREHEQTLLKAISKVQIQHKDKQLLRNLKKWLHIRLQHSKTEDDLTFTQMQSNFPSPISQKNLTQSIKRIDDSAELTLYLRMTAMKPFKEIINLYVPCEDESLTLDYLIQLNVKPPQPDEIITLSIDSIRKQCFSLSVDHLSFSQRKQTKLEQVSVRMEKGEIVAANFTEDRKNIKISFNPTHYTFHKKELYIDNLILEDSGNYWSYQIIFKFEKMATRRKQNIAK